MKLRILTLAVIAIFAVACSHYDELQKNIKQSKNGNDESHNQGRDCMQCHKAGGEAGKFESAKWWNIGVRIEDDILITTAEPEVLSGRLVKTVAEIEALMKEDSALNKIK